MEMSAKEEIFLSIGDDMEYVDGALFCCQYLFKNHISSVFFSLFFLFMHEKRTHSLSNMSVVPDIMKKENEYEEEARKRERERENWAEPGRDKGE